MPETVSLTLRAYLGWQLIIAQSLGEKSTDKEILH